MKYLLALVLLTALPSQAQNRYAGTPIYKVGEIMADGNVCHEGIIAIISRRPDVYGCDIDIDRAAGRTQRLNSEERADREREYDELKRKAQELDRLKAQ